jgi:hypothetical protein
MLALARQAYDRCPSHALHGVDHESTRGETIDVAMGRDDHATSSSRQVRERTACGIDVSARRGPFRRA